MKRNPTASTSKEPLMFSTAGLTQKYSVLEIATLAAGCRGDTRVDQLNEAVGMLALVERYASAGPEVVARILYKDTADENAVMQSRFERANAFGAEAERDDGGKIKRASLAALCSGGTEEHANRLYVAWLKHEADCCEKDFAEIAARFESGRKTIVMHDQHAALMAAMGFLKWLEERPEAPRAKIIQSQQEATRGQILSPQDKGAGRADNGQYESAQETGVVEHADRRD